MKNKILKISLVALCFIALSCSNDEQNLNNSKNSKQENKVASVENITFKEVSYNVSNKQEVMDSSMGELLEYIYFDLQFNSDHQNVTVGISDNKIENKFTLSYELSDIIVAKYASKNSTFGAGGEKLQIHCSGGKNDGDYKIVDKPTTKWGARVLAIRLNSFFNDCLDNGGCIEVCYYSATISKN